MGLLAIHSLELYVSLGSLLKGLISPLAMKFFVTFFSTKIDIRQMWGPTQGEVGEAGRDETTIVLPIGKITQMSSLKLPSAPQHY